MDISREWFTDDELHGIFSREWNSLARDGEKTGTLQGELLRAAAALCAAWFGRGEKAGCAECAWSFLRTAIHLRPQSGRLQVIAGLADVMAKAKDDGEYGRLLKILAGNVAREAELRPLMPVDADAVEG